MLQSSTKPKSSPFARNSLIRSASWKAVYDAMRLDASVHVFGEGCEVKSHFDSPDIERDFPSRLHTMPIAEDAIVNFAVGAALMGFKPLCDVISADFLYRAMDSIVNTAAKLEGHTIVIRAETLTGGPTTGQRPEAIFAHIPGLNVVLPSNPRDSYGLMAWALKHPGVTLFFEDRMISDAVGFDEGDLTYGKQDFTLGEPMVLPHFTCRMGQRGVCTVLTYGVMHQRIWQMLKDVPKEFDPEGGLRCDLIDLHSIYPVDWKALRFYLGRTGRLLIVEPDVLYGGVGAEIAAYIAETMPHIKIKRLGAPRRTIPAAPSLHHTALPSMEEIIEVITKW